MKSRHSKLALSASAFMALSGIQSAIAQELVPDRPAARLELGFGQSDNLNRHAAELRSDVTRLGAAFDVRRNGDRLRGVLVGDLQLAKYGADLPDDDELLGSVDGQVALHAVQDRFWWDIRHGSGQVRTDPRAPISPENRERTAVTALGPNLALPLGGRNSFEASAYLSERRFQTTSELDSELTNLRVGVSRVINPVTRVALRFEQSKNEFDVQPDAYRFKTLMLEYRKELASGEAAVSAGRGRVEIGGESDSTLVTRLNWSRALGSRSNLEIYGGRELTDAGQLFASGGVMGGALDTSGLLSVPRTEDGRLQGVVLSRSPLRRRTAGARFDVGGELGRFSVSLATAEDRFEIAPNLDNDSTTLTLGGVRQLNPLWEIEAYVTRFDQDYMVIATENEDHFLRVTLSRQLARSTHLRLSLERNRRVNAVDAFDENLALVSLRRDFGR